MSRALLGDGGGCRAGRARGLMALRLARRVGVAAVGVLGLVAAAGTASAAGSEDYACPEQSSLTKLTTGFWNVACGPEAAFSDTTGAGNVAVGRRALYSNIEGLSNISVGQEAGELVTGSYNIDMANRGVTGESGVTRIGSEGAQTQVFIAGIANSGVEPGCAVWVSSAGQLGCREEHRGHAEGVIFNGTEPPLETLGKDGDFYIDTTTNALYGPRGHGVWGSPVSLIGPQGATGQTGQVGPQGAQGTQGNAAIATFKSNAAVASGRCLNSTNSAAPGTGACPVPSTGYSASKLLSLAMPANGATVSDLYAASNATLAGSDTAVVEVTDNTTSAVLLTCTLNSTNKHACSNKGTSGAVGAGDKLEVKITAAGATGVGKDWEVTFRY